MTDQSFTLVPTDWLQRMEKSMGDLHARLDGATVVPAPEWLTIAEAAKELGVHPDTIRRRIEAGSLEAKGYGKTRRVKITPGA